MSALTTQTGRGIVAIEDWLWSLYTWSKKVKDLVKSGQTGETLEEVAEIKYHIASAKMVSSREEPVYTLRVDQHLPCRTSPTPWSGESCSGTICVGVTSISSFAHRIREGAQQEAFRRERTRIWMARHIRHREPNIADRDVRGLLKAAELGAADGIAECHVA